MSSTYTVFTRHKHTGKVKKVASGLSVTQAREMCKASNAPCLDRWCEFTTDKDFKDSFGRG